MIDDKFSSEPSDDKAIKFRVYHGSFNATISR